MILVALLLQATTVAPDVPQSFSILAPTNCRRDEAHGDILVCGRAEVQNRLPLPDERGPPDRPTPSNPYLTGKGALAASATPCAATQWGCDAPVNPLGPAVMAVRAIGKLINPSSDCCTKDQATNPITLVADGVKGVSRAFAKKPDKSNRVPIDLDDPPLPPLQP